MLVFRWDVLPIRRLSTYRRTPNVGGVGGRPETHPFRGQPWPSGRFEGLPRSAASHGGMVSFCGLVTTLITRVFPVELV